MKPLNLERMLRGHPESIGQFAAFLLTVLLSVSSPLLAAEGDSVTIRATEGGIQLEATPNALTDDERENLMTWVNKRLEDSAFFLHGGRVTLRLGDTRLKKLRAALALLAKGDPSEMERSFDNLVEDVEEGAEKTIIGDRFRVEAGQSIDQLVAIGSRGTILGRVKTLILLGSHVVIAPTGEVTDKLVAVGSQVVREPGSTVSSEEINIYLPGTGKFWHNLAAQWRENQFWNDVGFVTRSLGTLALALLYLLLFPAFSQKNRVYLEERWGTGLAYGLLGVLAVVPGVVVLILTVFGILLVPFYLIGVVVLWTLGQIEVATCLGQRLLGRRSPHLLVGFLTGFALFQFLGWIPWIGSVLVILATLSGFGAFMVGLFRQWKPV